MLACAWFRGPWGAKSRSIRLDIECMALSDEFGKCCFLYTIEAVAPGVYLKRVVGRILEVTVSGFALLCVTSVAFIQWKLQFLIFVAVYMKSFVFVISFVYPRNL